MSLSSKASALETLSSGLRANVAWFMNSAIIAAGSFASATLGFFYWWLAARCFSPEVVGSASASTSLMGLIGVFGEIGLGAFLVGEAREESARMAVAALLTSAVVSMLCALGVVAAAHSLGFGAKFLSTDPLSTLVLALGCSATSTALVLDQSFVGFLKGHLSFLRNIVFSAMKLAFLAFLAFSAWTAPSEFAIVASWTLACGVSILVPLFSKEGSILARRPDFSSLYEARAKIIRHHALDIATLGSGLALPVVVAATLGPASNSAFYPLWTILNVALLAPASLTIVLFTVVSRSPEKLASSLAASLLLSVAAGLAVSLVFYFWSRDILAIFNRAYVEIAGDDLRLLGFGFLAVTAKQHYVALSRIENAMLKASGVLALGGLAEVAFAALGGYAGGLSGFVSAWLAAAFLQAVLVSFPLLGALRGSREKGAPRRRLAFGSRT
ncbi:lipopolysaccharide biosynthesis protein [Methylocystis sp. S23]|jgi:O-antigen/teichoic acid export membrane protein